jgi:hypothetical protein
MLYNGGFYVFLARPNTSSGYCSTDGKSRCFVSTFRKTMGSSIGNGAENPRSGVDFYLFKLRMGFLVGRRNYIGEIMNVTGVLEKYRRLVERFQ